MVISQIRQKLLQRRREIMALREDETASWEKLHEPEVEFEERAAKEKMSRVLEQLDDQEKREIEQIDAALAKIETSGFGICESCGKTISETRLAAIPWTPFCIHCAKKQQGELSTAPEGEKISESSAATGQQSYTDTEIQEMIRGHLIRDDRIDTNELTITSKDAWIYIDGSLPSESEHEMLISIIQDTLGFKNIVDHIKIDRQLWEQRKYARGIADKTMTQEEKMMQGEGGETDVWTSQEFGTSLVPPDKLEPGKETK